MSGNNLPPDPPPVFLPEPKRDPEPTPHTPTRRASPDDLKFDFPADPPLAEPEPAPRGNNLSRFVFWLILGVIAVVGFQSGSPIPLVVVAVAAILFGKRRRWRR